MGATIAIALEIFEGTPVLRLRPSSYKRLARQLFERHVAVESTGRSVDQIQGMGEFKGFVHGVAIFVSPDGSEILGDVDIEADLNDRASRAP